MNIKKCLPAWLRALSSEFAQVGCVAVHNEYHVTLLVSDDGILVCCSVVKELLASCHGVLGGFSLGGSNCTERCEHSGVDCPAVVEKNTHYFLYEFILSGVKAS